MKQLSNTDNQRPTKVWDSGKSSRGKMSIEPPIKEWRADHCQGTEVSEGS
eukprot:SAG31_NODE_36584_length_312_cov_0.718310_1_plen_49_part_10